MKEKIKKIIKKLVEWIIQKECSISVKFASMAHKQLKWIQWRVPPQPEHFDHNIDLFYQWLKTRNSLWLERGVFGSLTLKNMGNTLDLACGDGFNSRNFYSLRSKSVTACDFDPKAIETAKAKNSAPNITYVLTDIRNNLPKGKFDNVFWDAAIEHFTLEEINSILTEIKKIMNEDGIISGYTIVEKKTGHKSLSHHEYEFKSKEDLLKIIKPYFKNVFVFETTFPNNHNLYFWAGDGILPMFPNWTHSVISTEK